MLRRCGEEYDDDEIAGLDIMFDISLSADMISVLKDSRFSRVTKSLRILSKVPCSCELEMEPSLA